MKSNTGYERFIHDIVRGVSNCKRSTTAYFDSIKKPRQQD